MARVHGGEMIARVLQAAGVRELFTLHGGHIDPILEACDRHGFRIVDVRHEQAAAHMADAWARTTGRLGVCAVTAGPGVTDAVTGVANAFMDCVPVLVLGGRSPLRDEDTLPLQGFPQLEMMRPITKWARCVYHPERIPEYVAMAIRQATTGRPGPVYLEVPIDVLFASCDEEQVVWPQQLRPEHPPAPRPEAVEAVLDLLEKAERPVILAGGGVWFSGGADLLRELAEVTSVPVFMNVKARGAVPEDTPLGYGGFGIFSSGLVQREVGPADLVLVLGARLGLFTGGRRQSVIPPSATVVQVDIEGEEIGRNRDVQVGIEADCREFLRLLVEGARRRRWPERSRWLDVLQQAQRERQQAFAQALERDDVPIHPFRLAHELAQRLGPDDVVVADPPAIGQLVEAHRRLDGPVLGLVEVAREEVSRYGVVEGEPLGGDDFRVRSTVEKPEPDEAPSTLAVIGRMVLTPDIFPVLEETPPGRAGEVWLTDGLARLCQRRPLYGRRLRGRWLDTGNPQGLLEASLWLAARDPALARRLKGYLQGAG